MRRGQPYSLGRDSVSSRCGLSISRCKALGSCYETRCLRSLCGTHDLWLLVCIWCLLLQREQAIHLKNQIPQLWEVGLFLLSSSSHAVCWRCSHSRRRHLWPLACDGIGSLAVGHKAREGTGVCLSSGFSVGLHGGWLVTHTAQYRVCLELPRCILQQQSCVVLPMSPVGSPVPILPAGVGEHSAS